jgi:hypothetical protein
VTCRELRLLLRRGLGLVSGFPFGIGHAVHDRARLLVGEIEAAFLGRSPIPFGQAVAAEAGQVHEVDVLHLGMGAEMLDQRAKRRRLELHAGALVEIADVSHDVVFPLHLL